MSLKWIGRLSLGIALLAVAIQMRAQNAPNAPSAPATPSAPNTQNSTDAFKTEKEKVSYAIGVQVAKGLRTDKVDVDLPTLIKGLQDALGSGSVLMNDQDINATLSAFQREMAQKQATDNQKEGDAFLADNAKKDGVVTQPSGLQYKVIKAADGKKPTDGDTVLCQYRGTLVDGTEFDSTQGQGKPAALQVSQLIPGIREALKLMTVGSTYQFVIPAQLAYGAAGAGNAIGPNATLVFEIELIGIQEPTGATQGPASAPIQPRPQDQGPAKP